MIKVPRKCPKADVCSLNCEATVLTKEKQVDVVFVVDKDHQQSIDLLLKIANLTELPYAVTFTQRYFGRKTDECRDAFAADLRRLKPKVLAFVGQGGYKSYGGIFGNTGLSEYEWRGTWGKTEFEGVQYETFHMLHPSTLQGTPSLAGIFKQDIERVLNPKLRALHVVDGKTIILNTFNEAKDYIKYLALETPSEMVGFDLETKNLNKHYGNGIVTFQFSDDGKTGYVIPWQHPEASWTLEQQHKLKALFIKLFTTKTKFSSFICHNGLFEATQIYSAFGVIIDQTILDTLPGAWLLEENRLELGHSFSLEALFREFKFDKYAGLDTAIERHRKSGTLDQLPLKSLGPYGSRDAFGDYQLFMCLRELAKHQDYLVPWIRQLKYYFSPVYKMFATMAYNGAKVDLEQIRYLKSPQSPIKNRMKEIEKELYALPSVKKVNKTLLKNNKIGHMKPLFGDAPTLFKLNETESKRLLFFDALDLDPVDFGKPDRATLGKTFCPHDMQITKDKKHLKCVRCGAISYGKLDKKFQSEYAAIKEVSLFVEYSGMKKLLTSYVNQLYNFVDPEYGDVDCQDQKVRSDQNPTGTVTSRASTRNPNTAQLPKSGKSAAKTAIKNLFIPSDENKILIQIDQATFEVRGAGLLAQDKNLAKIYIEADRLQKIFLADPTPENEKIAELYADIHKQTAGLMFGTKAELVEKDMRDSSKSITFGLMYGMGIPTLASNLGKKKGETEILVDKFFSQFSNLKTWIADQHKFVRTNHYVQNPLGVRRRLSSFLTDQEWAHAQALRQSVNSQVQGCCAQIMMIGGSLLNQHIIDNKLDKEWGLYLINYIHDAFVMEVDQEHCSKAIKLAQRFLTTEVTNYCIQNFGMNFNLPLAVDCEIGIKLGEMKKLNGTKENYIKAKKGLGFGT
jgi:DNA polymerase I-like protein with 3'-5' exonuclease and polymerase domains